MATLPKTDAWPVDVYQIDQTDPVLGGPDGPPNKASGALSNRSNYQRLRNVTPWDAALAAQFGYPDKACVMHGGLSWRSRVNANTVAPGTDPSAWERWGYSKSELDDELAEFLPYGVPIVCPNAGPVVGANRAKIHKSALGEYWIWLGDAWRVVAGAYGRSAVGTNTPAASTPLSVQTFTCHRNGLFSVNLHVNATTVAANQQIIAVFQLNGVSSARAMSFAPAVGWLTACSLSHLLRLQAGDVVECFVTNSVVGALNWGLGISYVD